MTILVVYETAPNFPATDQQPGARRHEIEVDGKTLIVDALGGEPTPAEVRKFLTPATPSVILARES